MFGLFRKKPDSSKPAPQMADINGIPLAEGDFVESLRYDLGKCRLLKTDKGFVYESLENGRQVSWLQMIDASTDQQKVKKLLPQNGH
ncbi:hypothetical protein SAMN05421823_10886 [Catalinimonas alkaloidigena]|uniref:Uncharacterized protein n=2 Tax=Catalinimonas alkaloidigena TaxID=1075417 RepID=A0A1G9MTY9_9BACT|nr:hypothetical protein SAMN05421823_10886 [Catalinimonas alkaloidigena]